MRIVMVAIAQQMGTAFREVDEPLPQAIGEWIMLTDLGTDDPNGTVKIRLGCVDDAKLLEQNIQGCIVVIGGRRVCVQVSNPVLLQGGSGNC